MMAKRKLLYRNVPKYDMSRWGGAAIEINVQL
jgi:hypothetical protein